MHGSSLRYAYLVVSSAMDAHCEVPSSLGAPALLQALCTVIFKGAERLQTELDNQGSRAVAEVTNRQSAASGATRFLKSHEEAPPTKIPKHDAGAMATAQGRRAKEVEDTATNGVRPPPARLASRASSMPPARRAPAKDIADLEITKRKDDGRRSALF